MTIYRVKDEDTCSIVSAIIKSESTALAKSGVRFPVLDIPEGAIWSSILAGDAVYLDREDPRALIWLSVDKQQGIVNVKHVWGPSERHKNLLLFVADQIAALGYGSLPVKIPLGTPISDLALQTVSSIMVVSPTGREAVAESATKSSPLLTSAGAVKDADVEPETAPPPPPKD